MIPIYIAIAAVTLTVLGVVAIVKRHRTPGSVAKRLVRVVAQTVPSALADALFHARLKLHLLRDEALQRLAKARARLGAACERAMKPDAAELMFGPRRVAYARFFVFLDFTGQLGAAFLTIARGPAVIVGIAIAATVLPAGAAAFVAEKSFRVFHRRPEGVRNALDFVAFGLGITAGVALVLLTAAKVLGYAFGDLVEAQLPLLVQLVAGTGGLAGGVLYGVARYVHSEDHFAADVRREEMNVYVLDAALKQLDEIDGGAGGDFATGAGRVPTPPKTPPRLLPVSRAVPPALVLLLLGAGMASAQSSVCQIAFDGSASPAAAELADGTARVTNSIPSFVEVFGCSRLVVTRFAGSAVFVHRRSFVVPTLPPDLLDCSKAVVPAPANPFVAAFREIVRGRSEVLQQRAVADCLTGRGIAVRQLTNQWAALRDSVAQVVSVRAPLKETDGTDIVDVVAEATSASTRFVATVILTDGLENVHRTVPPMTVPGGIRVFLVLVPAAEQFGGEIESARWAMEWNAKVRGLTVLGWGEITGTDYWVSTDLRPRRIVSEVVHP